jgi:hypothetical protein
LGTSADYARGYADGLAGRNFSTIESASYEEGYTDGKAAAAPDNRPLPPTFKGWILEYDGTTQTVLHDNTELRPIWNYEAADTDGFHSGSDTFITVPEGLEGWYALNLIVIWGGEDPDEDTEVGRRSVGFVRNDYDDPVPGFWQGMDLRSGNTMTSTINSIALLNAGDTLEVSLQCAYANDDLRIMFDPGYEDDTVWMGRYIGPA